MKNQIIKIFLFFALITSCELLITSYRANAWDAQKLVALSKQVIEAKTNEDAYRALEETTDLYFNEHRYNEYADFLNSLEKQKKELGPAINYYTGLTRYYQMKYLEETQNWDEYFSQGNNYRDQITASLQKTIDTLGPGEVLGLYARLVLWKFHRDQQDSLNESALSDLMNATLAYAQSATTNLVPLKDTAAELFAYGEKAKAREIHKVYTDKLLASQVSDDELKNIAAGFYKEGNLELSEAIYNAYIERILKSMPPEKSAAALIEIANQFAYRSPGISDPAYAEKVFEKLEEAGGKGVFQEELIYLRAFNLEKMKEYEKAKDIYQDLASRYPASSHADEADFKTGLIYTYILRDIKGGRGYFEKLARKDAVNPQVVSAIYQLGLLSQWENDAAKAKEYYHKLLEKAGASFSESTACAKQRLGEIEKEEAIEYNLRTFLDVSLKEENKAFDMTKLDLRAEPAVAAKGVNININSNASPAGGGCMQVELQYLWSGTTGATVPSAGQAGFDTSYSEPGTKLIGVVVVSPSGIVDRSIDILDIR